MQKISKYLVKHKKAFLALAAILVALLLTIIYAIPMYRNYVHENQIRKVMSDIHTEIMENISAHNNQIYDNALSGSISLNLTPQVGGIDLYLKPNGTLYFPALTLSLTPPNGSSISLLWFSSIYPYGWTTINETLRYDGFEVQYMSTKGLYWTQVYNSTSSNLITISITPPKVENLAGYSLSMSYMLGPGIINYTFPKDTPNPIFIYGTS